MEVIGWAFFIRTIKSPIIPKKVRQTTKEKKTGEEILY